MEAFGFDIQHTPVDRESINQYKAMYTDLHACVADFASVARKPAAMSAKSAIGILGVRGAGGYDSVWAQVFFGVLPPH